MFDYLNSVNDPPIKATAVKSQALHEHIVIYEEGLFHPCRTLCLEEKGAHAFIVYDTRRLEYGKPLDPSPARYGYCEECKALYERDHLGK